MIWYLGAPFFNPQQLATVENLERIIESIPGFTLLSPRRLGVLQTMTPEDRKRSAMTIFKKNIDDVLRCDALLAVIDDRDTGTMFELGFAYGNGKAVYTYTDYPERNVNIMLQGGVCGHARGLDEVAAMLAAVRYGELPQVILARYQPHLIGAI